MPGGDAQPESLFPDTPQAAPLGYALVAPERSVDLGEGGFTYAVPTNLADLAVGQRVIVPLGRGDDDAAPSRHWSVAVPVSPSR